MSQRDYFEKDYYATLGMSKSASAAEVAKAYRKLARELHPDARPGDKQAEERFKEVSEAYSVLSNPEKRKEYDQVREMVSSGRFAGFDAGGFGGQGPGGGGFGGFRTAGGPGPGPGGAYQTFDLGDLFGEAFRGAGTRGRGRGQRGRDLETDLTLSFEDAMAGVTTTLRVSGRTACSVCGGNGAAPGTSPVPCPTCGGSGTIAHDQGLFSFSEPCPTCGGSGRQIPTPCPNCQGSGVEARTREIKARIPAGVKDGARIRLKGKGEPGPGGGPAGDLFVNVHVTPHEVFGRRGEHLTLRVPVTFAEAALGTRITVPTLDGPVTLKVPAGTESGRTFRVRGKGAPATNATRGDLLVTVDVAVPRKLTKTQRKLLEDFAATEDTSIRDHLQSTAGTPRS